MAYTPMKVISLWPEKMEEGSREGRARRNIEYSTQIWQQTLPFHSYFKKSVLSLFYLIQVNLILAVAYV